MSLIQRLVALVDGWQRRNRPAAIVYAVVKKFGDDDAHLYVVTLGWYGFLATFPLLLAVVTVLAFIGAGSLGHQFTNTLQQFPVVGSQFHPARASPGSHGSALGLAVGLAGLVYGAQGVTQTVQQAMVHVWNIPYTEVAGFRQRLVRSLSGLAIIGCAFVTSAALSTLATGGNANVLLKITALGAMLLANCGLYAAAFRALTPAVVQARSLVPGAVVAAFAFSFLITLGSGLVQHQLRNSSATYGPFGAVIGLVTFLFLLATLSLYGAELNSVLNQKLWPRALRRSHPTEADARVLDDQSRQLPNRRMRRGLGVSDQRNSECDTSAGGQRSVPPGRPPGLCPAPWDRCADPAVPGGFVIRCDRVVTAEEGGRSSSLPGCE